MEKFTDKNSLIDSLSRLSLNEQLADTERKSINALVEAIVKLGEELDGFTAEGLGYQDLSRKSLFFTQLQRVLNVGNQIVHLKNVERKDALNKCTRPPKIKGMNEIISEIESLPQVDQILLITKLTAEREGK
uniref:Uncharacterized protein n=1 Tax=viral metagenome TaxID=1070528 RepID=A0A2V0RBX2_9ZZZZ